MSKVSSSDPAHSITDPIDDVIPKVASPLHHTKSIEKEIMSYIYHRFGEINREIGSSISFDVEVPEEVWKRARLEIEHYRDPGERIDNGDGEIDNIFFGYLFPEYEWHVNGIPLSEVSFDDVDL